MYGRDFVMTRLVFFGHSYFAEETFADVHKVDGLRGIYIASALSINRTLSSENQVTYITYNKGARWLPIRPPLTDSLGYHYNCTSGRYSTWWQSGPVTIYIGFDMTNCYAVLRLYQNKTMAGRGSHAGTFHSPKLK